MDTKHFYQVKKKISFLKIDVEGFEEKVLLGADFDKYRPEVIVIESTLPRTDIPCYDQWEYILIRNNYKFAFECGINRYYVAAEKEDKFKDKYKRFKFIAFSNIVKM